MNSTPRALGILRRLLVPGFLLVMASKCLALPPPYYPDDELVKVPIIVVAKWVYEPIRNHDFVVGDTAEQEESFTKLDVIQVIKGNVKPGVQSLMVHWIYWKPDGSGLVSSSSTAMPGEVENVAEPNIWFLSTAQSWDKTDKTTYLEIHDYRSVQPLVLEPYFGVLAGDNPGANVLKLLSCKDATIVENALLYGWNSWEPWPFADENPNGLPKKDISHDAWVEGAASIVERKDLKELRPLAAAVYAQLEGKKGVSYLRNLLKDGDPKVRGVAASWLVKLKDADSIEPVTHALTGRQDSDTACQLIEAASEWGDARLAPLLMAYLESGGMLTYSDGDLGIPALKARQALRDITGHWFPYDVKASLQAWKEVSQVSDSGKRNKLLEKILPVDPPLKAELSGNGTGNAICKVTNKSQQNVYITREPYDYNEVASNGSGGRGNPEPKSREDFVLLKPGESIECKIKLEDFMLLSAPASRQLKIDYANTGEQWGVKAWVGAVNVAFGHGWKEPKINENAVEKWPDGNLKAKGTLVNGRKYGCWDYFNEAGDRIKSEYYSEDGVPTIEEENGNPELKVMYVRLSESEYKTLKARHPNLDIEHLGDDVYSIVGKEPWGISDRFLKQRSNDPEVGRFFDKVVETQ